MAEVDQLVEAILREAKGEDHFYGAWKGGSKAQGGGPAGKPGGGGGGGGETKVAPAKAEPTKPAAKPEPKPEPPKPAKPAARMFAGRVTGGTKAQQDMAREFLGEVPPHLLPAGSFIQIHSASEMAGRRGSGELFGQWENGGMHLNARVFKEGKAYSREDLRFDTLHEAGHGVMAQVGWGRSPALKRVSVSDLRNNPSFKTVTSYGRLNGADEAWAEAFATRMTGRKPPFGWGKEDERIFKELGI